MNCSKGGEERPVGQSARRGPCNAKVDDLGHGTPSLIVTRMFDGLMSRWMIPF